MIRYIVKRLLWLIPVLLGVITISFVLTAITPGDPVDSLIGADASQEAKDSLRAELGLDQPLLVRYVKYIVDFVTKGDLGTSYRSKEPVLKEILHRYPKTMVLAFLSLLLAVIVGIPLGVISSVKQNTWIDNTSMATSLVAVSMPQFWLGLLLIIAFAVKLRWLPASGVSKTVGWILPIVTCGFGSSANIARITRSSMLEVIRQDYVRTARAKGQKDTVIILKHALKNALIPIITSVGSQVSVMLGGTVTIEAVFSIPGIGKYMVDSLSQRDYPAIQGGILFLAVVFSIVNLLVDIAYAYVDPRIMAKYRSKKRPSKKAETAAPAAPAAPAAQ